MKEIYILRHAEKDETGNLTEAGKIIAADFSKRLGHFDFVFSSDKPRAIETATLLTGSKPVIDIRASAISFTPEEIQSTHEQGKDHKFGIAGVLFDSDMYRPKIIEKGNNLVELIEELWNKLSHNERALIISHDGVMVAAYMPLLNLDLSKAGRTFEPLQGFRVFGNFSIEAIK